MSRVPPPAGRRRGRTAAAALAVLALAVALVGGPGGAAGQAVATEAVDTERIEALRAAAAEGDAGALFRLADLYERGEGGFEHDLGAAAAYLRLAAERGHPEAQYRLGLLRAYGLGAEGDRAEGYGWLSLAAEADPEGAIGLLAGSLRDALGERMTPDEVRRGRELAAAFEPLQGPPDGLPALASAATAAATATAGPEPIPLASACDGEGDEELAPSLCRILDLFGEHAAKLDRDMEIVLRGAGGEPVEVFEDGDYLIVELPPAPAAAAGDGDGAPRYVAVDYFVHDGQVLHMFPGRAAPPSAPVPADEALLLGDPRTPGGQAWQIGPPFGRDLLAVFVSERPLYLSGRPQIEPTADYLDVLGPRLRGDEAVRYGYRLVTTLPRGGQGAVASGDEPG